MAALSSLCEQQVLFIAPGALDQGPGAGALGVRREAGVSSWITINQCLVEQYSAILSQKGNREN